MAKRHLKLSDAQHEELEGHAAKLTAALRITGMACWALGLHLPWCEPKPLDC
jgi:hypothetical protein